MLKSTTTSPVLDAPPPQLPLLATPLDPGPCELLLDPELAEPPVELELAELLVPEPEGAADPPVELDDEPDAAVELERVAAAPEVELDVEPEAVAADEERLVVPVVGPLAPVVVLEEDPQAMRVTTAAGSVIFR